MSLDALKMGMHMHIRCFWLIMIFEIGGWSNIFSVAEKNSAQRH